MRARLAKLHWMNVAALSLLAALPHAAFAQGTSGPVVTDSKVGYIDSAIPGNIFRIRYDTTYNNRQPSRAELFYAQGQPLGPGLPFPEPRVDYQDFMAYAEATILPQFSVFLELPVRFLNPEVNANANGFADLNAGFKYAFLESDTGLLSFQFRTFVPSGDATRGLGNNHVSLEPALLYYQSLGERAAIEGEFRYWVPIGGTDFAGQILRYGIGGHYSIVNNDCWRLGPVIEFVGWTVLNGKESTVQPSASRSAATRRARRSSTPRSACGSASEIASIFRRLGTAADGRSLVREHLPFEMRVLY